MAATPGVTPRSLAGIALLEGLQERESGRSGTYRDPDIDFADNRHEIAGYLADPVVAATIVEYL